MRFAICWRWSRNRPVWLVGLALVLTALLASVALAQTDSTAARNLTAELLPGSGITLRWEAPAEDAASVSGYEILRRRPWLGEQSLLSFVADTGSADTSYTDLDATEAGQRYVYRVVALRGAERSATSNFARVDIPQPDDAAQPDDAPLPSQIDLAPSNLSALVAELGITLTWTAPAADPQTVTGYRLLRAVGVSPLTILVADTGSIANAYFDTSAVSPGETYRYQVLALRGQEASQGFLAAVVSFPDPLIISEQSSDPDLTAPSNLIARIVNGQIWLTWDAPTEDVSSITGYRIYRSNNSIQYHSMRNHSNSTATHHWGGYFPTAGATYYYKVAARRPGSISAASNASSIAQPLACAATDFNTTPVDVPVTALPIVVASTIDDYFVLYVKPDLDETREIPISVTLGTPDTTTLVDRLSDLPIAHYRVAKYPVASPADTDRDCIGDIIELADPGHV